MELYFSTPMTTARVVRRLGYPTRQYLGHRPGHLLRIAGLAGSAYFHRLSRPGHVTRAGLEPLAGEIWARAANGCGHRQIRMCLVHGFGCLCSMVLRPVERLVFSPKER